MTLPPEAVGGIGAPGGGKADSWKGGQEAALRPLGPADGHPAQPTAGWFDGPRPILRAIRRTGGPVNGLKPALRTGELANW